MMEQAKKVTITSAVDEQGMDYIDMRNFAQSVENDRLMVDSRWEKRKFTIDKLIFNWCKKNKLKCDE